MLFRIYNRFRMNYTLFVKVKFDNSKFILSNYIPESIIQSNKPEYLMKHSNKKENNIIVENFLNNGFNYIGISPSFRLNFLAKFVFRILDSRIKVILFQDKRIFKQIFSASNKFIIFYSTGCYYTHQNYQIINKTDRFNQKYNSNVPYYRLAKDFYTDILPNMIFSIGTNSTVNTYPKELHDRFHFTSTIALDSNLFKIEQKINSFDRNKFIWFGSNGSILKGLDVLIEYFSINTDYELHVVGTIDEEVRIILNTLKTDNIHIHGMMKLNDIKLIKIAYQCCWVLFPSASEGIPGSLINMMKMGCIPITSEFSKYTDLPSIGFILETISYRGIEKVFSEIENLTNLDIKEMISKSFNIASEMFSEVNFQKRINYAIKKINI